jgi:ThiF family
MRLIDFDYVTLSSLNRHATAALADVGTPKVQCIARALHAIALFVQVDPPVELWRDGADGAELLQIGLLVRGAALGLNDTVNFAIYVFHPVGYFLSWVLGPSHNRRAYKSPRRTTTSSHVHAPTSLPRPLSL